MNANKILLDHGSGGRASHELVREIIYPYFENAILAQMDDSAVFSIADERFAFSTDSYVVDPIFFPEGSIGNLAVNGTVNDLAMCGAKPLFISVGFIIEEGFPLEDLQKILRHMQQAAQEADVKIVTGDTKVVYSKAADKIFINTSGIGRIPDRVNLSGENAVPGDRIILSGTVADHGITILTQREGLCMDFPLKSDTAPLNHMVQKIIESSRHVHSLRDPTRGGVATSLNEIAAQAGVGIMIDESAIPVRSETRAACELLGLDPLYIANEGKLIACVAAADTEAVLAAIRTSPYGQDAQIIGEVTAVHRGKVFMETAIGGARILDMLAGEQLPRIC
ncbi:MAG: hydrogenase expression/formation protein HypE [Deltaproteobacteria bacterium]|nr:hydrogenase expression/formation protein HypE [Deltaproteobacteria bacterium]MBW1995763.1 hydrogenase expression/formation protein HypE [Deltaproteobacteria bacterium]